MQNDNIESICCENRSSKRSIPFNFDFYFCSYLFSHLDVIDKNKRGRKKALQIDWPDQIIIIEVQLVYCWRWFQGENNSEVRMEEVSNAKTKLCAKQFECPSPRSVNDDDDDGDWPIGDWMGA